MIYVQIGIIIVVVGFNTILFNYNVKGRKVNKLLKMGILPGQLWIYDKLLKKYVAQSKIKKDRELLGENDEEKVRIEYAKRLTIANIIVVCVCMLTIFLGMKEESNEKIVKPEYYDGSKDMDIVVDIDNTDGDLSDEDKEVIEENLSITIETTKMTQESFDELVDEVVEYVYEELPGENTSLDEIIHPINMVTTYPDNSEVSITWITDEEGYIDSKGNITEVPKAEDEVVELLAIIGCHGYETMVSINICILQRDLSSVELLKEFIKISVEEQNKDTESKTITLPDEIGGIKLSYPVKKDNTRLVVLVLIGGVMAVVVVFGRDYEVKKRAIKLRGAMEREYPHIVAKLTLLMKGGMNITRAWRKLASDGGGDEYGNKNIYELMGMSVKEMDSGVSVCESMRNFAIKTQCEPYIRLSTYINQNINKGTGVILDILELEMLKATTERKNAILRAGEKAGTKMIFPMILLLIIVLAITIIPALMMM